MSRLPSGWSTAKLGDLGKWASGGTPSRKNASYFGGAIRWVKTGDLADNVLLETPETITEAGLENSSCKVFPPGTLLVAMYGATIGKTAVLGVPAATNQACAALLPEGITADVIPYVWHFLIGNAERLKEAGQGGAQPNISQEIIKEIKVPVPPLAEQHRVVAKVRGLRGYSLRASRELSRIPNLIDHYRQAILAKAFSGELTKEWREQNTKIGTGAQALAKIEDARNSLVKGRAPTRRGPVSNGEAGRIPVEIPELPATWEQSSLEAITSPVRLIQYGILKPGDDVAGGVPYVKVMNIRGGHVRLEKIRRTTTEIHAQYRRSAIATGDILLSIRGTVGRLAFVPPELDGGNITQDSVRIDVLPGMNARFVYWYLHSPVAQDYFAKNQKGVAVRGINVGDVRPMEIPIPSEAEQVRIVTLVEHALAWLDNIAIEYARAEALLPKLDDAILAKAFRGELVHQDPNDEPAEKLLARIRAEREEAGSGGRRAKSG